jgi:hypothetical protein
MPRSGDNIAYDQYGKRQPTGRVDTRNADETTANDRNGPLLFVILKLIDLSTNLCFGTVLSKIFWCIKPNNLTFSHGALDYTPSRGPCYIGTL